MQLRGRTPQLLPCASTSALPPSRSIGEAGVARDATRLDRPTLRDPGRQRGPEKTKRHGEIRASFASVRPEQSVVAVVRFARPSTAARCFTTLSTRDSGLFTRELVRGSFLVGGAPTLRSDCALRLGIHRSESAGSLATHTACIACLRSALSSRPADRSTTSASHSAAAAYAALFHPVPFVVGLVCHYRSPAAIFEFVSRGRVEIRPASGGLSGGGPRLSE
jgi:hypothetical protein